eukprot:GHVR01123434.1.p1 GENE.GHVR01123434.1~~GHVR01123434.1.p1  ORF type:complete len:1336 (+),score=366.00 GHVR01123434.1:50-4057(+)
MDDLERGELRASVASVLHSCIGVDDLDLVDYLISVAQETQTLSLFQQELAKDEFFSVDVASQVFSLVKRASESHPNTREAALPSSFSFLDDLSDDDHITKTKHTTDTHYKDGHTRDGHTTDGHTRDGHTRDGDCKKANSNRIAPPTEKELRFPGLCVPDKTDNPALMFKPPDENAPLSNSAQLLIEGEYTERERLMKQNESQKKDVSHTHTRTHTHTHTRTHTHTQAQPMEIDRNNNTTNNRSNDKRHASPNRRRSKSVDRRDRSPIGRRERSRSPGNRRDRRSVDRRDRRSVDRRDRRSRSRSPDRRRRKVNSRSPIGRWDRKSVEETGKMDTQLKPMPLEKYGIYKGKVNRVMEYGAFVSLYTSDGPKEGLVHANEIKPEGRLFAPRDFLKAHQSVYVKVVAITSTNKLTLSMREVDQVNGKDFKPRTHTHTHTDVDIDDDDQSQDGDGQTDTHTHNTHHLPFANPSRPSGSLAGGAYGSITGIALSDRSFLDGGGAGGANAGKRGKVYVSDYEKWEVSKMRQSGVLSVDELPDYDQTSGVHVETQTQEEFEVEVADSEPVFLLGQTTRTGAQLSPIRVVSNPDGTLARAAATQSLLSKERRENKDAQEKSLLDAVPRDMNRPWEDPHPAPGERTIAAALQGLGQQSLDTPDWKKLFINKTTSMGFKSNKPIKDQREALPIFKLRDTLLQAVKNNQVLVVIGETGSGKTTQMPQYLAEAGYTHTGIIGCTQPRRVAAMSIAKRVSEEFGCRLGQEVGYSIRFEDCTSVDTQVKYMTDGMLLREALLDNKLNKYSVVMLDEAHERTINTDVLFGLLKRAVKQRPEMKLIVTSATLDAEKFSSYFFSCHIFTIPGRTFPVEILYSKEAESDYVEAALITVLQIHLCEPEGDILLFLTGQEEIDTACATLHERMSKLANMRPPPLIPLPVYSSLPSEMQTMIFEPAPKGCRKCVVATNIAEASLTIDGIFYVIDPGFAKVKMYNNKTGMDSLVVAPISQANARQRAGRAGRTGPGKCYRLFTEAAYKTEMLATSVPEIQRTNLASTVLLLKALGVNDLMHFDFMDPPPVQTLIVALETLYELSALDDEGLMTPLGRRMAELPIEPTQSKMLLTSVDLKCSDEVITIVAMLSVQNVFYRPREKQALADQKKSKFFQPEGDHIMLLEVYRAWQAAKFSNAWCFENFVQSRTLRKAQDVRKQLITIMDRYKFEIHSAGKDYNRVRKSICAGFFRHSCKRDPQEGYRTLVDHQQVYLHPSSAVYQRNPDWIIYHELVLTTKEYLRECCTIEPYWLVELAPSLFKKADDTKMSYRKRKERIEPLYNRYEEPNSWRLSKRAW